MQQHEKWLHKAESDYRAACKLLEDESYPYIPEALFHMQQCAEKSFKAYLVFQGLDPERTHNLLMLIKACMAFDKSFEGLVRDAAELNLFSTITRYPEDDFVEPHLSTAQAYAKQAKHIFDFVVDKCG